MNQYTFEKLQYNHIIDKLKNYCSSELGRQEAKRLSPSNNISNVKQKLQVTTEARNLINTSNSIKLLGANDIRRIIDSVEKDMILNESQLSQVASFLVSGKKFKNQMKDKEFVAPYIFGVSQGIIVKQEIIEDIEYSIKNGKVCSEASSSLKSIRRHITINEEKVKEELEKFIRNDKNKPYLQETFISIRNGRQTIPIKASYKNLVSGTIIDSNKKTAFIEPSSVSKYVNKLDSLKIQESEEEFRILCQLTGIVYNHLDDMKLNLDTFAFLDLAFAKGKYSIDIDGMEPEINNHGYINIVNGKHMLLEGDVVPLNIEIGKDYRSLIITGPNAGGKTVVLKTVGLLTMAVQSGLHIPCKEGTNISVFDRIFADIGDDQSIENALSTFSSHVKNLAHCVNKTNKSTLLLFDEIGSGTDPNEGAALAIAILEDIYKKGAITIATTHYNEIKSYSQQHPDFKTAAMKFNKKTLEPLYQLIIGQSGESNAIWISRRMGIYEKILKQAEKYMSSKNYDFTKIEPSKIRHDQTTTESDYYDFKIGDKVFVNTLKRSGLVCKPKDLNNKVEVYFDGEIEKLHIRLLTLEVTSEDLYPSGYDMNQLFVSYKERKLERDIKRGSKKALKMIRKHGINELLK